jgi:hypothetical protein
MLQKNTRYKQVTRLQLFGDDNIFNKAQYHYATTGTVNNSIRMRFDLKGVYQIWYYHKMHELL